MTKKLIIIRGVPGSGKSTQAKKFLESFNSENIPAKHFEADMFFMRNGKYKWNPMLCGKAHQWCFDKVFNAFETSDVVIVSNTFVTNNELIKYVDEAKARGYEITVYRMDNEFQNQHEVPEATIQKMKSNFVDYEGEIRLKA